MQWSLIISDCLVMHNALTFDSWTNAHINLFTTQKQISFFCTFCKQTFYKFSLNLHRTFKIEFSTLLMSFFSVYFNFFLDACSLCDIICDWTCWLPDPSICRPAYTILATFVGTCFWPQHVALCYTDNSYSAGQGLYVYCFILNYILWAHFTLLFELYLLK